MKHNHSQALDALCGCAATVTVLSYQEAIEGYFALRGITLEQIEALASPSTTAKFTRPWCEGSSGAESVRAADGEVRKWLKAALGKRGAPSAFAAANGMSDESVLSFLRGKRPLEPKLADAIGYRRIVSYQPCGCHRCTKARTALERGPEMLGQPLAMMRMFLCETCGNKRCPHAADHRLECTGSNAPGQPGSLYEGASAVENKAETDQDLSENVSENMSEGAPPRPEKP